LLNVPGCDVGNLAGTLLEQARTDLQPWRNVYEDNFWFCLGAFFQKNLWLATTDSEPLLKL